MTPTQRTLAALRKRGLKCGIVERWIAQAKPHGKRLDLFGIIDILALDPVCGVIGIQSCGSAFSEHWKKLTIDNAQDTFDWLSTPGTSLELWGWRKLKLKRGGKAVRWSPRIRVITVDDLAKTIES